MKSKFLVGCLLIALCSLFYQPPAKADPIKSHPGYSLTIDLDLSIETPGINYQEKEDFTAATLEIATAETCLPEYNLRRHEIRIYGYNYSGDVSKRCNAPPQLSGRDYSTQHRT